MSEGALAAQLAATDAVFRALASAPRRQILLVMHFRGGSMTAGEVQDRFACSWPTTSRHLKVLREAGLVRCRKDGRVRHYSLDRGQLDRVAGQWLDRLRPDGVQT